VGVTDRPLADDAYRELLDLQDDLRRFLSWRDSRAAGAGLSAGQHQLLLSIRGHDDPAGPTIGDVADHLSLRHHSAVELVQRAEAAGLVVRRGDASDRRRVRLALGDAGLRALEALEPLHAEELRRLASGIGAIADGIERPARAATRAARAADESRAGVRPARSGPSPADARPAGATGATRVAHVHDAPGRDAGTRVLVDRSWPRGVRADDAPFDEWLSGVAPSSELRRWFAETGDRFEEFRARYVAELRSGGADGVARLHALRAEGPVVLLTAATDLERSAARVLADELAASAG